MNSNIIQMQRSGMLNDKSFGLIDNLGISYDGNQRTKIADAVSEPLTYNGAFDFVDEATEESEYAYNANGALIKDLNKGIEKIEYDLLGNPREVYMSGSRSIEYIYSADGRRLRTIHKDIQKKEFESINVGSAGSSTIKLKPKHTTATSRPLYLSVPIIDSTDYKGNLILKDGKPQMCRFSGGYYDFKDDGSLNDSHYYIADYMGNNRMVVNGTTGAVEQINHLIEKRHDSFRFNIL